MKSVPERAMSARETMDAYFLEVRAKLIEIGATLDRVDRAPGLVELRGDSRLIFIHDALEILKSGEPNRAELLQRRYSQE